MAKEKVPDGEMSTAELRKLVKAQNLIMKTEFITIPAKSKRDGVIKSIEDAGYKINHTKKQLEIDKVIRKKNVNMKKADQLIPVKKKMSAEEKKDKSEQSSKVKKEDVIKFILKNKSILNDDRIKVLHKGLK